MFLEPGHGAYPTIAAAMPDAVPKIEARARGRLISHMNVAGISFKNFSEPNPDFGFFLFRDCMRTKVVQGGLISPTFGLAQLSRPVTKIEENQRLISCTPSEILPACRGVKGPRHPEEGAKAGERYKGTKAQSGARLSPAGVCPNLTHFNCRGGISALNTKEYNRQKLESWFSALLCYCIEPLVV